MEPLRFIHCADLHLDRPFRGIRDVPNAIAERVRESTFRSFHRIVDAAIEQQVDFMIIAGDLFDNEQRSLRAQSRFRAEMVRLENHGIEVFAAHGNHDPLIEDQVPLKWPENVHIFSGSEVEAIPYVKHNETLANLYGFSYPQRAVTQRMSRFYEKKNEACYHIGILHGNVEGSDDHDPYAPFTIRELLEKEFDYWALGHIHKRQLLHEDPTILYPDNIQGLSKKETGEKGCTLVDLNPHSTSLSFIPTSDVEWQVRGVSILETETVEQLLHICEHEMDEMREKKSGVLVVFHFTGAGSLHRYLQEEENIEDLLLTLREAEDDKENFVWPVSCVVQTTLNWDRDVLKGDHHFIGDLLRMIDEEGFGEDTLDPLFNNRRARRFLEPMSDTEQADILREAENLLLTDLLSGEAAP